MAETSIKISLELADKMAQKALSDFINKGEAAEKGLGKLGKKGTDTFHEISVGIGRSLGVLDIFAGNIAANLTIKAFDALAGAASSLFNTFIVDGVRAAIEAEDALNSLNVALAQSGIYSKETSKEFEKFAEELQRTTAFEDDAIIKNAALIQSLGQLDKEGLKRATKAALNLSAAFDKDLGSASEALGKAANGNVVALQKMGFEIRKGNTDAETFANALAAIEAKVGTAAVSKVNTYSGAVAQASHNFGNLTEAVGNLIIKNPVLIAGIKEVTKIIAEWTDGTNEHSSALSSMVSSGINIILSASILLVKAIDGLITILQPATGAVQLFTAALLTFAYPLSLLVLGFDGANAAIANFTTSGIKNLGFFGSVGDGVLGAVAKDLTRIKDAAAGAVSPLDALSGSIGSIGSNLLGLKQASKVGEGEIFNSLTGSIEPLNKVKGKIREVTAEMQSAQDRLKAFGIDLVKQGESGKTAAETALETARAKSDSELEIQNRLFENRLISESQFLLNKEAILAQAEIARSAVEDAKFEADHERLLKALNREAITRGQYDQAKKQLDDQHKLEQIKGDAEEVRRKAKIGKEIRDQDKRENERRMAETAGLFGALGTLAATGGKRLFEITKAFNLAEAITSGILAVQKAASALPFPANVPGIVSMGALAAANVIRITQTKAPSFEDGGIVGGNSFTGDRISANVNSGEMILNRQQQKSLFSMANGGGSDNSRVEGLLSRLIVAIESQPITVNIGGRSVVETLRSELAGGRSFA